jgi:hypothetical protein
MAISTQRTTSSPVRSQPYAVVIAAVMAALVVNLIIYAIGKAAGGEFTYTQSGKKTTVDAASVTILSTVPLAIGLSLVALLSPRWPAFPRVATGVAPTFAIATIVLVTIPANFDATSTVFLSFMHLAVIPISLLAIARLAQRQRSAPE